MRKPYYKKSLKCWYITNPKTRREVRLDPDEDKAFEIWRRMLDAATPITPGVSITRLIEFFLEQNFEDTTAFKTTGRHLTEFGDHVGVKKAIEVTKRDIVEWLNAPKPGQRRKNDKGEWIPGDTIQWSARSKHGAYAAIKKLYQWAVDNGHIHKNPIKGVKLESPEPRKSVISPEDHAKIIAAVDPCFRQYLLAASCGPRPAQIREVTAENVLPDFSAWVFSKHKTAHKTQRPLVVYLPPELQELTKELVTRYPTGPLFRNSRGQPWLKDTIVRKMQRLRNRLNLPEGTVLYLYRHTFATNALMNDVPIQVVSELLGHTDTRMVSKVYGHLDQHRHYLLEAARKAMNGEK